MISLLTLMGGLLAVAFNIIFAMFMLVDLVIAEDILYALPGGAAVAVVLLLLCITAIVFNAIVTRKDDRDNKAYTKKRGLLIATVVINFVITVFSLIGTILTSFYTPTLIVFLSWCLTSAASGALILTAICLDEKHVEQIKAARQRKVKGPFNQDKQ